MTAVLRPPYREDQGSISRWAEETFGAVDGTRADSLPRLDGALMLLIKTRALLEMWPEAMGANLRVAVRALEEMCELVEKLAHRDHDRAALPEVADVFIILYRLADRFNADVHEEVDAKMRINRGRTWKKDGTGHGYHVRDGVDHPKCGNGCCPGPTCRNVPA